jgi:hypothetical protein
MLHLARGGDLEAFFDAALRLELLLGHFALLGTIPPRTTGLSGMTGDHGMALSRAAPKKRGW